MLYSSIAAFRKKHFMETKFNEKFYIWSGWALKVFKFIHSSHNSEQQDRHNCMYY